MTDDKKPNWERMYLSRTQDYDDAIIEVEKLKIALIKIDQIAQEMQTSKLNSVRLFAADIRVYSDEEQRQDGL